MSNIEYKNMSFEKREDGVWIHKDWALPGDFGDIHDKPASKQLQLEVEAAYQELNAEKVLPKSTKTNKSFNPFKPAKCVDLDFTKPLPKQEAKPTKEKPIKVVKKTTLKGGFNPFKMATEI